MSSEEVLPSVVFVNCSNGSGVEKLMELVNTDESERSVWKVDTKYYEATVELVGVGLNELDYLTSELVKRAGGVVLYYDGNFEKSSEGMNAVAAKLSDCDAGVKLLVCDSCDPENSRLLAEGWCVDQGFEHLELEGPEGDESRLKQALEAHFWPNLVHKVDGGQKKMTQDAEDLASGDLDDDFSTLFQHFATIKEQAVGLPPDERKNFAEQVVLAYWRSIGGDEDELLDV